MNLDDIRISFTRRSIPIPPDYRPLYKIALILLILFISGRAGKASLLKIQLFIWALKSKDNQTEFESLLTGEEDVNLWGLDPTVIRALNFATEENLCVHENGRIKITSKGELFAKTLIKEDVMTNQREFLKSIGKSLSEEHIKKIAKEWTN